MRSFASPDDRFLRHDRPRFARAVENDAKAHAGPQPVAFVRDRRTHDEIAAVLRNARIGRHDPCVYGARGVGKRRDLDDLPRTKRVEDRFRRREVDKERTALVDLGNRRRIVHAVAGIDFGKSDMTAERCAHHPVRQGGSGLLQRNARRCKRGLAGLDLAFGNRAGVFYSSISTEQLVGFAYIDLRCLHREPLLPGIEANERLSTPDEIARAEHHAGHATRGFGEDFGRCRGAGRTDRLDFRFLRKDADFLRHHRHRIAFRLGLGFSTSHADERESNDTKSEDRTWHPRDLTDYPGMGKQRETESVIRYAQPVGRNIVCIGRP